MSMNYWIAHPDEAPREQLEAFLSKLNRWTNRTDSTQSIDINDLFKDTQNDILFISPNAPGFDWNTLDTNDKKQLVVLITDARDSAAEAYDKGIFHMLPSNFSENDIERLAKRINTIVLNNKKDYDSNIEPFIFVKSDYKIIRIKINDIQFIESMREYVRIHTADQKVITLLSLSKLEELLPNHTFMRVHRSTIINIQKINFIQGNIISIGNEQISISKSQKDSIMDYVMKNGLF